MGSQIDSLEHRIQDASADEMPLVRELFEEYSKTLDFDLGFQGFSEELLGLPGSYVPPSGAILLAFVEGELAGCVALRPFEQRISEMKRLYVRSKFHGQGLGRRLAQAIVTRAQSIGYEKIRLDTVPSMRVAISMYQSMGFYPIESYRENPIPGTSYLQKDL